MGKLYGVLHSNWRAIVPTTRIMEADHQLLQGLAQQTGKQHQEIIRLVRHMGDVTYPRIEQAQVFVRVLLGL